MTDPNDPDTGGRAVPPYEGRRASGEVAGADQVHRDGANVGGATGPVEDEDPVTPASGDPTGSPADEQPAASTPQTDLDDDGVGPAHQAGTPRAEDQP
jgi:hypothetical protein